MRHRQVVRLEGVFWLVGPADTWFVTDPSACPLIAVVSMPDGSYRQCPSDTPLAIVVRDVTPVTRVCRGCGMLRPIESVNLCKVCLTDQIRGANCG